MWLLEKILDPMLHMIEIALSIFVLVICLSWFSVLDKLYYLMFVIIKH